MYATKTQDSYTKKNPTQELGLRTQIFILFYVYIIVKLK